MPALVNVAIYDATIAAWDTKYAYTRPRPRERDGALPLALAAPASPSYPSEDAVAAGAAYAVLAYLFPNAAAFVRDKAEEAGQQPRLAGLRLSQAVAARVIARARADRSDAQWDGKFHYWTARPNQFDPTITTVLPTYAIPDDPGGHATTGTATETMLAYLFPREAAYFLSRAQELAASRI